MRWDRWFYGPLRDAAGDNDGSGDNKVKDKDQNDDKKPPKEEDDLDENEVKAARQLYKALKDPDTAKEVINNMANRLGLFDKKGEPTENRSETKKELGRITKKLRSSLGKDFEKFSDLVGPALDEAIAEIIEDKFGESASSNVQDKWSEAVDKFTETHVTTGKIEKKMRDLIERNPPNLNRRGFEASEYLEDMWELAHKKLGMDIPKPESKKQRGEALPEVVEKVVDRELTTDEAIELAMRGIRVRRK